MGARQHAKLPAEGDLEVAALGGRDDAPGHELWAQDPAAAGELSCDRGAQLAFRVELRRVGVTRKCNRYADVAGPEFDAQTFCQATHRKFRGPI